MSEENLNQVKQVIFLAIFAFALYGLFNWLPGGEANEKIFPQTTLDNSDDKNVMKLPSEGVQNTSKISPEEEELIVKMDLFEKMQQEKVLGVSDIEKFFYISLPESGISKATKNRYLALSDNAGLKLKQLSIDEKMVIESRDKMTGKISLKELFEEDQKLLKIAERAYNVAVWSAKK